ncbi:MAG: hypothetical protein LBS70_01170 [Candidatus Accumulibacter sp.]|jgi:S1-C subfamily serine protease|nr:hypothetical protein [Accumulibacter sp.]
MNFSGRMMFSAAAGALPWLERALAALVCWQAAGLAWWLFAPGTGGPMPAPPRLAPGQTESRDAFLAWFEDGKTDAPTASDYSLMAVIAGRDGVAVLKGADGKSLAVRTGEAVDSGSRLLSVEPDSATLERGGARLSVRLPQGKAPPVIAGAGRAPAGAVPARAAPAAPIRITHGQMVSVMQGINVAGWDKGLSNAPDGGVRIDRAAAQPFAALLQLKDGDVLKKVNGRPISRLADISLIFFHFGQSPSVTLDLIRRGASITQRYDIQP